MGEGQHRSAGVPATADGPAAATGERTGPPGDSAPMSFAEFGVVARALSAEARRQGLQVPGFCSPPGLPDETRTVRGLGAGSAMVAVRLRGRPRAAVVGDMVEGILHVNGMRDPVAEATRSRLLAAAGISRAAA